MIASNSNIQPSLKTLTIQISGTDAGKFLQGQLTCDVFALKDGASSLGAYCNIKGKVESLFNLTKIGDDFILQTHPELLDATLNELKKYAVFSKVTLSKLEKDLPQTDAKQEIINKIPCLYPQTVGMFFPHDLNLPALNAVSFTKGCYRGQEIVARMQHRGNLKRQLYVFTTDGAPIKPGDEIRNLDNIVGNVVRVYQDESGSILGLAVITDSYITQPLHVATKPISLL